MLYGRRKRVTELTEAEAAGESFWTRELDEPARYKILYAVSELTKDTGTSDGGLNLLQAARNAVLQSDGIPNLAGESSISDDVTRCILEADLDLLLSTIEAILTSAQFSIRRYFLDTERLDIAIWSSRLPAFRDTISTVLREHRVNVGLVEDRFVDFDSRELHESVVAPTLTLLGDRTDLVSVEKAYKDALEEIHGGKAEDAITDAGTALQEMLVALGCQGNSLGPLINDAKSRGLLGPHDSNLTAAIEKAMEWVSADRSNMGDGHNATSAEREDAWLIVHVVGALVLRLSSDTPRTA